MKPHITFAALVLLGIAATGALAAQTVTAYKTGERITGQTKQCSYAFGANQYTRTVRSYQLCALSIQVSLTGRAPAPARPRSENLEGQGFSLRDVERRCEVYKYSRNYGDLDCRGSELRTVERRCEVYFYDLGNGEIECRGSELRLIERRCSVTLYSDRYGDISCR